MKNDSVKKLTLCALFCALTFAATMISVPAPLVGNVNLGDGIILVSSWFLGGIFCALSSAVGAMLSDIVGGFAIYAPATFIIKALVAFVAFVVYIVLRKTKIPDIPSKIISGLAGELIMIFGYLIYESLFLGYGAGAFANVPFNAIQGAIGITVAVIVGKVIDGIKKAQIR